MKPWVKGGLIGFIAVFVGLILLLLITGHDPDGWKCTKISGAAYCTFFEFISSPIHWAFILFFSWVGFFGGAIDARLIRKIIEKNQNSKRIYLKITLAIMLTLVIVFGIVGLLAFDKWVEIMIYAVSFVIFVLFISWLIGRWKYGK